MELGVDLLEHKDLHYLLSVDLYSKWIELAKLDNLSSINTIKYPKSQFSRYWIPDQLVYDNGPQFTKFEVFSKKYRLIHTTTGSRYLQANDQVQLAVQTVKTLKQSQGSTQSNDELSKHTT